MWISFLPGTDLRGARGLWVQPQQVGSAPRNGVSNESNGTDTLGAGAGAWAEGLESVGQGFEDPGLDGEEVEFAVAPDIDQSA